MTVGRLDCDAVDDLAAGFVLGALAPAEADGVREHLATCERAHPAFAELGGVVPYLALDAAPVEPADALRARIVAAVRADERGLAPVQPTRIGIVRRAQTRWVALLLAAALIVAVGGSALLAVRLGESRAYADHAAQAAALAAVPGSRTISVQPASGASPTGTAVVAADGRGVIVLDGLAPVAGSQVYEVWVIAGSGQPTPAGALQMTSDGRGWLDGVGAPSQGALTIALTREPGPGATTPTLPIVASGSAG